MQPSTKTQNQAAELPPGRFVVLEGLDGSGKSVQFQLLTAYLHQREIPVATVDFPNYAGFYGKLVGRYLNQEFGDVYDVNPHFSSLLYAGDRLEAKPRLEAALREGRFLLANRYVGANLAYHSVKLPQEQGQRAEFIEWLKELEYVVHGIPREDLTIFLHAPVATAQQMVDRKASRDYTTAQRDIHERNAEYLEEVRQQFVWLCEAIPNWVQLDVFDHEAGTLFSPEETHQKIVALLRERSFL
jgi:dTMP kinase